MATFGDLIKEAVGGHFFTKISIPINKVGYKEALGVALRSSALQDGTRSDKFFLPL
jgi:hypothetical protein